MGRVPGGRVPAREPRRPAIRSVKPLGSYFPEVTRAIRATVPPGVVLDGELIVWDKDRERSSRSPCFSAGSPRAGTSTGTPDDGPRTTWSSTCSPTGRRSLLGLPLRERRRRLEQLLAGAPNEVVLTPQTDSLDARPGVARHVDRDRDRGRGREDAWIGRTGLGSGAGGSMRTRSTTEAIVGGITGWMSAPQTVLVGRFDTRGRLRYVGRSTPLTDAQRAELVPLLSRPVAQRRGAPVRASVAERRCRRRGRGSGRSRSRSGTSRSNPRWWPRLLVDTAFEHSRWRHRVRYVRLRAELHPMQLPTIEDEALWRP